MSDEGKKEKENTEKENTKSETEVTPDKSDYVNPGVKTARMRDNDYEDPGESAE